VKPIQINAHADGYTVTARGLGTLTRLPNGKLGFSNGAPAVLSKDDAVSMAHQIGRYKLNLGDFVFAYTSAPFDFE
jgi:hypothetical protein